MCVAGRPEGVRPLPSACRAASFRSSTRSASSTTSLLQIASTARSEAPISRQPAPGLINPGSFTPLTNNSAKGGHVIWNYTALSSPAGGNPTSWSPAGGFTLLDGDIAWINKQGFPHASQWSIQTQQAAATPSITSTGDTADTFNSASVSLVAASGGAAKPSGIHINKIIHESWVALSSSATLRLQLPTTGNLRVLAFAAGQNNIHITSITDSDNSVWTVKQTNGDSAQIWYAANRPANPGLIVSIHTSGTSPTNSVRFFDIQGAAASPLDVAAGTDLTPCSSQTTIANQPTITTTGANELVIATMGIGDGPGLGMASGAPTGAVWDLPTYSGEVDTDLMENADATGASLRDDAQRPSIGIGPSRPMATTPARQKL